MVRCEEFYREFEKKGNFCGKSNEIVKKVEEYMSYMKRHKFGDFLISNSAIEPMIRIEYLKDGVVHKFALKDIRRKVKRFGARGITRKISIESINYANNMVLSKYKIESIPEVRSRMGTFEHTIDGISHEVRDVFDEFKKVNKFKDNNETMMQLLKNRVSKNRIQIISVP